MITKQVASNIEAGDEMALKEKCPRCKEPYRFQITEHGAAPGKSPDRTETVRRCRCGTKAVA